MLTRGYNLGHFGCRTLAVDTSLCDDSVVVKHRARALAFWAII